MIHCAIYPRKSKANENSESMNVQIDMCLSYLRNKYGIENVDFDCTIYDGDYGITGHSVEKRHDFQRMMADVKDKKINIVAIQRYDRIARNTRDFCNLYHEMEVNGCELVSVSQQIDTTTPYGKNFMYMQASMAELEWALNSERRKDVVKYSISVGKSCFSNRCTPFGYKNVVIDGIRKMVIDKEKEPIVRDIYAQYRKYRNLTQVMRFVASKYGLKMHKETIHKVLFTEFYKGKYRQNTAFCEPYLSEEEWDELHKIRPVFKFGNAKKYDTLFVGLVQCPLCGKNMHARNNKLSNGKMTKLYYCRTHQELKCDFKKTKLETVMERNLLDYVMNYTKNMSGSVSGKNNTSDKSEKDIVKYEKELDRLNIMFQKGRIEEEKYDAEYERISQIIAGLKKNVAESKKEGNTNFEFTGTWKEVYDKLDTLHKKMFWSEIVEKIIIDENFEIASIIFL